MIMIMNITIITIFTAVILNTPRNKAAGSDKLFSKAFIVDKDLSTKKLCALWAKLDKDEISPTRLRSDDPSTGIQGRAHLRSVIASTNSASLTNEK